MSSLKTNFFYPLILCVYFFNVNYKFMPPGALLISSLLIFTSLFEKKINFKFKKNQINNISTPLLILSILLIFCFLSFFQSDHSELFGFQLISYLIIASVIVPLFLKSQIKDRETIYKILYKVGFLNAILMIAMFLSPTIKDAYLQLLSSTHPALTDENHNFHLRAIGLTGFATYATAFMQTCFLFVFILYKNKKNKTLSINDIFIFNVISVSSILAGRSAFIGIALSIILIILAFPFSQFIKLFIYSIPFYLISIYLSYIFLPDNFYSYFTDWVIEPFTKGIETNSLRENKEMFNIDTSSISLMGDFRWFEKTGYYMGIDVGYLRIAFAHGLAGLFLSIIFIAFYLIPSKDKFSYTVRFFLVIFIFLLLLKGSILTDTFQVFTILTLILMNEREYEK